MKASGGNLFKTGSRWDIRKENISSPTYDSPDNRGMGRDQSGWVRARKRLALLAISALRLGLRCAAGDSRFFEVETIGAGLLFGGGG